MYLSKACLSCLFYSLLMAVSLTGLVKAESYSDQATTGLYLFVNEEEQQRIDAQERKPTAKNGIPEPVIGDAGRSESNKIDGYKADSDSERKKNSKQGVEKDDGEDQTIGRYNGVVMKGDKVLDIWMGGQRFAVSEMSRSLKIQSVDRNGTIHLSGLGEIVQLSPGDLIPVHLGGYPPSHQQGAD